MGSSTTHRGGPSFQKNNTARGKESIGGYSDSGRSGYSGGRRDNTPSGGELSGGKTLREGVKPSARDKTSSSRSTVKTKTSFGQS